MNDNKFRAWIKSEKKYIYLIGFVADPEDSIIRIWWSQGLRTFNKSYPIDNIILEQFTGSKDRYEGDVVKSGMTGAIYQIYWNDEYSGWHKKCINAEKKDIPIYQDDSSSSVISNIHEQLNKERV